MTNNAQNTARSRRSAAQTDYKSLFNLVQRTLQGNRVICQDLTFAQAAALVAEIPAAIIKFNRIEAAQ